MGGGAEPSRLINELDSRSGAEVSSADESPASNTTVLLVDDEILVRDVAQTALEEGGYTVKVANSGRTAIAILEEPGARPRALITDVILGGGPSGWDVARRAREISPGVAIIYITGGQAHEYAAQGVPGSALLSKPFAADQIVSAVSALVPVEAAAGNPAAKSD